MQELINDLTELKLLAQGFVKKYSSGAIVGLSGELGSGKTTFVRNVIEVLAEKSGVKIERVMSPSFVLHQSYPDLSPPVEHFDLYRMEKVNREMLVELEYYEIVERVKNLHGFLFIEWPEQCLDKSTLKLNLNIEIEFSGTGRQFKFTP